MKKKRKKKNDFGEKLQLMQERINKYSSCLKNPINEHVTANINSNSWFDINKSNQHKLITCDTKNIKCAELKEDGYYTNRIKLYLNETQKRIINKWLYAYILMFNYTSKYFRICRYNKEKPIINLTALKKHLYNEKLNIQKWSKIALNNRKKTVDSHLLDGAIQDALNRYKSCLSNLRNGNIKYFRLRYMKMNKERKIFKIEKSAFKEKTFYSSVLGKKVECSIKNYNYLANIETTATLQYIKKTNIYYLLVKKQVSKTNDKNNNIISIDPGIRTLITGYSNNHILTIGNKCNGMINKRLKTIDKINRINGNIIVKKKGEIILENKFFSDNKKAKITAKKYANIKNKIQDMQWKTVKYLTENYKTILIGNFSTKDMGESKKIQKMTKRVGNMLNIYKLKLKFKYYCNKTGTQYKEVNEAYSSKCCSNCGNYKKTLGGAKIYKCLECKQLIGRDINGAKNILCLGL